MKPQDTKSPTDSGMMVIEIAGTPFLLPFDIGVAMAKGMAQAIRLRRDWSCDSFKIAPDNPQINMRILSVAEVAQIHLNTDSTG